MNKKHTTIYFSLDIIASIIAWIIFFEFRFHVNDMVMFPSVAPLYNRASHIWMSLISFPIITSITNYLSGIYITSSPHSRIIEFFSTFVSNFFASIILYFILIPNDKVVDSQFYVYAFLVLWGLLFSIMYLFRLSYTLFRIHHLVKTKVLIIGTGSTAQMLSKELRHKSCELIGHIRIENQQDEASLKAPILGHLAQLSTVISDHHIERIIIASENRDDDYIYNIINQLIPLKVSVEVAPRTYEVLMGRFNIHNFSKSPTIQVNNSSMPAWQLAFKRATDIFFSALGMVLLTPLLLIIACGIKWSSKGPIIYKQERLGKDGKPFNILKFRTMVRDAEKEGPSLAHQEDPRITKIGAFLRKYRLDELPQLWNIFIGEMSIVGPRPERWFYIQQIQRRAPYYCLLYNIQPGLFSWGPIKIGYSDTIEKMIQRLNFDILYLNNMSLFLDLKIILYSIEVLIKGKGI